MPDDNNSSNFDDRRISSPDRIFRLEVITETIHKDFDRIHNDLTSIEQTFDEHVISDNASFQEINKSLILLSSTVREVSVSVSQLSDSVRELRISQELMNKDIIQLSTCKESVDRLQKQVDTNETKISELEAIKNSQAGSWKTVLIVGIVVSFLWGAAWTINDHFTPTPQIRIIQSNDPTVRPQQGK
jgi:hypothetical protein